MMLEKHRHLLIKFRQDISRDLLVDDVLPYLQSKLVLDSYDKECIYVEKTSKKKAQRLLDILPTKGFDAFEHFFTILGGKYPQLVGLLRSGVSDETYGDAIDSVDSPDQLQQMSILHRRMITVQRVEIVTDLLVDDVLNQLQASFVFDSDDKEQIKAENTPRRQAEKLLDLLLTKSDATFYHFKKALDEPYPHLAELLEGEEVIPRKESDVRELQERVENVLLEGGVPQRPDIFTNRARDVHKVRAALRSLKEHDGWVILHGMAGCGKTVLAAEALRSPGLLDQLFPGGVFWIRIGSVSQAKLLMQMQNLCVRLDHDHSRAPPRNLEEAKDRLRMLFAHQYPRSLLVLDDLWNAADVKYFDIRCRTLVTTRDASITDSVGGSKVKVRVSEGFSDKEALQILSLWTRTFDLPPEAIKLVNLCNGSPLAISMIGAMLKEHPNRWKYYLNQFQKKKVSKLKTKFAYEYPSLSEAILMGINNLSEEMRTYYIDFALFDDGSKVPAQVLCILWDEELEIVEDLMDELVNKSLARKCVQSQDALGISYSIHNLQLAFLQELSTDKVALHAKIIDRYRDVYGGKFDVMEDDHYIHWNLIRHMLKANMVEDTYTLITSLSWVVSKLKVTGPSDVISDYISVRDSIKAEQELEVLDNFHHFVSTNAHLFVAKMMPDIVQLALQQPSLSQVHTQAKAQASILTKQGKMYIEWCNQRADTLDSRLLITAKVHCGAVYCCKFSSDSSKVVSCGTDNHVKVWDSQSGRQMLSISGHGDVVNCCAFSHDDSRIISCSADQTVKIWDASSGEGVLCFVGHTQEVFSCSFSPDDTKAVSCSADRTVKVWDSKTGVCYHVYMAHTDIVRWCCFSPDGGKVASCSDDNTVRIWDASSGEDLCLLDDHTSSVSFCCFMNQGESVVTVCSNCIKVWSCSSGEQTWVYNSSSTCLSLAFSPDDSIVAMGFSDTTVQLWNSKTFARLGVYKGHKGWAHSVGISKDSSKLVSGSEDETVKIWTIDRDAAKDAAKLRRVFDAHFGEDSLGVAVADSSDRLLIFQGQDGVLTAEGEAMDSKIHSVTFSPRGEAIAVGCESGTISIQDRSCKVLQSFSEHKGAVRRCYFSQDGQLLLSASDDKTAKVFNLQEAQVMYTLAGHTNKLRRCMFFNNDTRILTASLDGSLKVWDAKTGNLEFTCCHSSTDYVLTCDVSHDSQRLISASADCFAKVWDASTGELLLSLGRHPDVVRSISFSPDNMICTGCDDGIVRIWDSVSGKEVTSCKKNETWIADCHFTRDGRNIVSVSDNIQWWSKSGQLIQEFFIKGGFAKDVKCSSDFKTFVTVDDTSTLYILNQI
ncbi:apoptotic protease-activating factor 1 isoform X2 [Nematostella vectensis]|uniref:apoptotic protease-activating factor 1 isoform X2 n=1 Tax=Nematostella vectensis TaxID=45351 RepID=UPI002076EC68|nr:apoptotic protease-activating factor 1 isoform X2 [Nematostella vectensis]